MTGCLQVCQCRFLVSRFSHRYGTFLTISSFGLSEEGHDSAFAEIATTYSMYHKKMKKKQAKKENKAINFHLHTAVFTSLAPSRGLCRHFICPELFSSKWFRPFHQILYSVREPRNKSDNYVKQIYLKNYIE